MKKKKKEKINVIFLDIDGVCNCKNTTQRSRGFIGIDPYLAFLVGKIILYTECKVVLSSSWRHFGDGVMEIKQQICPLYDVTPTLGFDEETRGLSMKHELRGTEIKKWLSEHNEVDKYVIIDDENDMLPEQQEFFYKTSWDTGITEEIVEKIINYFGKK